MKLPAPLRDLIAALLMVGLSFGAAAALSNLNEAPPACPQTCAMNH